MEFIKNFLNTKAAPILINPSVLLVLIVMAMLLFAWAIKRDKNILLTVALWFFLVEIIVGILYSIYWAPRPADKIPAMQAEIVELKTVLNKEVQAKIAYEAINKLKKTQAELQQSSAAEKEFEQFLGMIGEANAGDPTKQYAAGLRYMSGGAHLKKNTEQALIWIKRAGSRGYKDALYYLGRYYQSGKDLDSQKYSCYWMSLAASQRHEKATVEAQRLCAALPKNAQEAIRSNVAEWKPIK
ncbi:MAG: sel1 repeat family protein [Alphaproteobacteria bacterium]|nr:sel1 repeat family protein [Alphaproteobacteria bacterium]